MATQEQVATNWIDPDIAAYNEAAGITAVFSSNEEAFRRFFEETWLEPRFDSLRPTWGPLLNDIEPAGRVLAKTALWSVARMRFKDIDELVTNPRD